MSDYYISQVRASDRYAQQQVDRLLQEEGIRRDANLDYTCAMYDEAMNIIATGSCFENTLRCMAVSSTHQGEGLMNEIVTHLIAHEFERGKSHLFLYTKCDSAKFFGDLGFSEIIYELPLDQSRFLEPADPPEFLVILLILFLHIGDCVSHGTLGE